MLEVVERPAVERVERAAARASDQVGGRRSIETSEMLQIVGVDRTLAVADAELLDDNGEIAHVERTMTKGDTNRLELVWEHRNGDLSTGDDGTTAIPPMPAPTSG